MKILTFEWMTGGGLLKDREAIDESGSLYQQGSMMILALAEDLLAAGHQVTVAMDHRGKWPAVLGSAQCLPVSDPTFAELIAEAQGSDAVWLVAPETGNRLAHTIECFSSTNVRLLNPGREFVELTSSKHRTSEWLAQRGVQPEFGALHRSHSGSFPSELRPPRVVKPDDGAGSESLMLWIEGPPPQLTGGDWRVEEVLRGDPVSVVVVQGPRCRWMLEPLYQCFDRQPFGVYVGGRYPVEAATAARTRSLVARALDALPAFSGYIGFDLVIDADGSPQNDRIVDINPRLTSSYLGLRQLYSENLADLVVRIVSGEPVACPTPHHRSQWQFHLD